MKQQVFVMLAIRWQQLVEHQPQNVPGLICIPERAAVASQLIELGNEEIFRPSAAICFSSA